MVVHAAEHDGAAGGERFVKELGAVVPLSDAEVGVAVFGEMGGP